MTIIYRAVICLILICGALAVDAPSGAVLAQDDGAQDAGGRIAFVAFKNGQWDIFSISAAGDDLRQVTNDSYEDDQPAYSPDGGRLAYASRREGNWDIYLLDLASGEETRLTDHPDYDGAPAWHPDGNQIAFESYRGRDLDLWLLDLTAESSPVSLTADSAAGEFDPVWDDQGQRLFFASWRFGDNDIWALTLDTNELVQITETPASDSQPAWNPFDQTLAFTRNTLGDKDIFVLADAGETESAEQWSWLGSLEGATFSPDGRSLVGYYQRREGAQLVRLDGGDPVPYFLTEPAILRQTTTWHSQPIVFGQPALTLHNEDGDGLYTETLTPSASPHGEPYDLIRINDLQTGTPWLADTVEESYQAWRMQLRDEVGYDFLGEVSETLRPINFSSDVSQYSSWHKSGRAVDTLFDLPGGRMQIVRQNISGETYWRILLRCEDQSGRCGRPTTANPWNYSYQARAVIAPEQGGIENPNLYGYWVDFTGLGELYGWRRIASFDDEEFSWTWHFIAFEYWHYQKMPPPGPKGLESGWYQAMKDVYPPQEVETYFTWEQMRAAGEAPYLIIAKGVPLPPAAERWQQRLVP